MSMYADYMKERSGAGTIETRFGFLTYKIQGEECMIVELYTQPERRLEGIGKELVNDLIDIAKEKNCKYISATVIPSAIGSTQALIGALKLGFKLHSANLNCIIIVKEV